MKTYINILQKLLGEEESIYPEQGNQFEFAKEFWKRTTATTSNNNNNPKHGIIIPTTYEEIKIHIYFFIQNLYVIPQTDLNVRLRRQLKLSLKQFIKNKYLKLSGFFAKDDSFQFQNFNEKILEITNKAQRAYNGFARLAQIARSKQKISIDMDLLLNPIDPNHKNTIKLNQNNSNFLFTVRDLVQIIETALSNAPNFFAEPLPIKNPYNNVELKHADLYNIYFKVRASDYNIPMLFHNFFLCAFDKNRFCIENQYLIREESIKRTVNNTNPNVLFKNVRRMLQLTTNNALKISDEIDKIKFVEIMRPYYYLYLVANYQIHGLEKTRRASIVFRNRINELREYNPRFGRTYMKRVPLKKRTKQVFDLDHPRFTMNDALKYEFRESVEAYDFDDEEEEEMDFNHGIIDNNNNNNNNDNTNMNDTNDTNDDSSEETEDEDEEEEEEEENSDERMEWDYENGTWYDVEDATPNT